VWSCTLEPPPSGFPFDTRSKSKQVSLLVAVTLSFGFVYKSVLSLCFIVVFEPGVLQNWFVSGGIDKIRTTKIRSDIETALSVRIFVITSEDNE
jgi:hypothetical protein